MPEATPATHKKTAQPSALTTFLSSINSLKHQSIQPAFKHKNSLPEVNHTFTHDETPRHTMLKHVQQLAFDVLAMVRSFVLEPNEEKRAENNIEAFSNAFKDRFSLFKQDYRYRGEPKVLYVVMKSEGDILMELRSVEAAIVTYKEIVSS